MLSSRLGLTASRKKLFRKIGFSLLIALAICVLLGLIVSPWRREIIDFLDENKKQLTLVSYVAGPLFALIGFILGTLDKVELADKSDELGRKAQIAIAAEKRANDAEAAAHDEAKTARKLRSELEGITKGAEQLWKLRPPRPFPGYRERALETEGARFVSIVNLKGGVGKTTITANYAAYLSEHLRKRVLVVDLDYQGSLSGMLLTSVGRPDQGSLVDPLFGASANFLTVDAARVHLVPKSPDIAMRMSQAWLVPAATSLAQIENQLLLSWLLDSPDEVDVRYRLAHVLLDPNIRRQYDVVLFDLPPRMTLGAINAIVASNFFFIPTVLDGLSAEAVPLLAANVRELKLDLGLHVELAGIIGTMTQYQKRSDDEERHLKEAAVAAAAQWLLQQEQPELEAYALATSIPKRAHVAGAAGNSIAILENDDSKNPIPPIFTALFDEMSQRIGISGK